MRTLFTLLLGFLVFLQYGGIAIGSEDPVAADLISQCTTIWCQLLGKFPELNAWVIALFTFLMLVLRACADLLGFVGQRLQKDTSSKWGEKLGSWSLWAAQVVGWFGGGTPKVVIEKKVADVTTGKTK